MPPPRKSNPLSPGQGALGQAIELFIAEDPAMTQQTVADESGISVKQINAFVRGQGNPRYLNLLKLCEGLHVSPGKFMSRVDELHDKRKCRP
jgi:hypothetical protein